MNFRGPLLAALVGAGHQVVACAPDNDTRLVDRLKALGIRFRSINLSRNSLSLLRDAVCIASLVRLIREERPDVTLAYTAKPVIYGSLAAAASSVPAIYSIITGLGYAFTDTNLRRRLLAWVMGWLYRWALRYNRTVFFQNRDDLELFRRRRLISSRCPVVIINGSGVDLEQFSPALIAAQPPVFLLIARLLRDKGIVEFVEAARQIKCHYPEVMFDLVGPFDSNPSNIRRAEVENWQAEGILRYHDRVDDVRPFIKAASVYVLPSYREGMPRTILEAMAMGRAVITTDAPGCRETVITGENGFLVPVKDPKALARAMMRFILEPGLIESMGKRSRELAIQKFDVHSVNRVIMSAMGLCGSQTSQAAMEAATTPSLPGIFPRANP